MSKTILITGGAASGKTRWAVSYLAACDNVLYLCAAKAVDRETLNRIDFATRKNFVEWEIKENITGGSCIAHAELQICNFRQPCFICFRHNKEQVSGHF